MKFKFPAKLNKFFLDKRFNKITNCDLCRDLRHFESIYDHRAAVKD